MPSEELGGLLTLAREAALAALRWVTGAGIAAGDGMTWPETLARGARIADELYSGTAGVLAALAEARLCGITEHDECARAAMRRLRGLDVTADGPGGLGLYTGSAGAAAALHRWALAAGDQQAADAAGAVTAAIARRVTADGQVTGWLDIISGQAGILLVLAELGGASAAPAVGAIADRLVAAARWTGGEPAWLAGPGMTYELPNFSHGAAGIGYALAVAGARLGRPDLVDVAALAGRRLARLGRRPDGSIAVAHAIPALDEPEPVSYGWCHGPTGTLRLFQVLDLAQPGRGWADLAQACRRGVRASGLPARIRPGFWDNVGLCCGTAGVGEMALDRYQETGAREWLDWSAELAADVLGRRIADGDGVRWSQTEYRADPPDLEPEVGLMQGAAGIAAWLLRLARVGAEGSSARQLWWPDKPDPTHQWTATECDGTVA